MKRWLMGGLMAVMSLSLLPDVSEARRFGGGSSLGMQRATPAKPAPARQDAAATPATPAATPGTAAAPAAGAATAAGTAGRSWMGPVAGLAAGLGLAALASHLGFGEELANFMMLALLAVVAVVVIRLLMRRFGAAAGQGPRVAPAGAAGAAAWSAGPAGAAAPLRREMSGSPAPAVGSALRPALELPGVTSAAAAAPSALPADFDTEAFERIARMIFIRMQAANDAADLNDLRNFTTPELFAALRLELHDRGAAAQHTDVEEVKAEVLDFAEEDGRQIVSVQFQGRVREEAGAEATPFDEVWHLVKPLDDSRNWAIAGIQQRQ